MPQKTSFDASMQLEPKVITIGEIRKLSRRKARKLAYRYRGSRRGLWYKRYLAEDTHGFFVVNNRLVQFPRRIGPPVMHTYHSADAMALVKMMKDSGASVFSIETPDEVNFSGITERLSNDTQRSQADSC